MKFFKVVVMLKNPVQRNFFQKLDCLNHNPVNKKRQLVTGFTYYEYSSASFYEMGIRKYWKAGHINDSLNNNPGSPHTRLVCEDPRADQINATSTEWDVAVKQIVFVHLLNNDKKDL